MSEPTALENALGHVFVRPELLTTALTHSSYANERGEAAKHNERLEFLGDAVLELSVSEELFARFPEAPEGELTLLRSQLVNESSLAAMALRLSLEDHILLGKGEENQGGRTRPSLLSDVFEAVIGALFLDGGYGVAKSFVNATFAEVWPVRSVAPKTRDYKSRLQEYTQKVHKARPVYTLLDSEGPEHDKRFTVRLELPDGHALTAMEKSVKKAEQMAARLALEKISDAAATW
ncbi:ribonuclease III [Solidesulfovibrio fructosivorans JJ]]|uniref:Ribonuclease 3 n=1 Tax=Solidesulfovibrio fructosivorans JJ] TaxID=596151 RepID=E1K0L8_SOLFR|nr:ribonuclease III [Solidesulfovibrio fructosivorans]EFL49870.1 ribonuclease III [Solidesulfovibrio fructosivorans JJ]]